MTLPAPYRPLGIRLVNALGRGLSAVGLRVPSLDPDVVLAKARRETGLEDFGEPEFREGLTRLLDSGEREARLNLVGRNMLHGQAVTALRARLQVLDHARRHPEVREAPIARPIFIVGLPRTGTTILLNLLSMDPSTRAALDWEVERPLPPPEEATYRSDPRIAEVQARLDQIDRIAPHFKHIHEIGAELPQECVAILSGAFLSEQFDTMFDLPGYMAWMEAQSFAPAYRFHRLFLQVLQHRYRKERWVLKTPGHLPVLEDLLAEYPDACIVHTHRDPAKVVPSVASLCYTLRTAGSDHVNPAALGRQQADLWERNLRRAMAARDAFADRPEQFHDVQFAEVLEDPIGLIGRIYERFGIPFRDEARHAMERHLRDNPRGKHGTHRYDPEDFGLSAGGLREQFADYRDRFAIPSEPR